jgi:Peptidase inhibitor I9
VNQANHLSSLAKIVTRDAVTYQEVTHLYDTVLNGYACILRGAALDHVLNSKDVDFVEQDGITSIKYE